MAERVVMNGHSSTGWGAASGTAPVCRRCVKNAPMVRALGEVRVLAASRQSVGYSSFWCCYFSFLFPPLRNNLQMGVNSSHADGGFPLLHFYSLAPDSVERQVGILEPFWNCSWTVCFFHTHRCFFLSKRTTHVSSLLLLDYDECVVIPWAQQFLYPLNNCLLGNFEEPGTACSSS